MKKIIIPGIVDIIVALLGYLGIKYSTDRPIEATLTDEMKLTEFYNINTSKTLISSTTKEMTYTTTKNIPNITDFTIAISNDYTLDYALNQHRRAINLGYISNQCCPK